MGGWLNTMLAGMVAQAAPWLAIPAMAIVGMVFGLVGGYVGKKFLPK